MQDSNSASSTRHKIKTLEELAQISADLKSRGEAVVQCHGVFDLLHVGHIRHLEEARSSGDILIVTITPDRFVNKGPDHPAFPEELRAEALSALMEVDYVAINQSPTAVTAIELIKPSVYAKGPDYTDLDADITGGIGDEKNAVESNGGKIAFTNDITFSSSSLINRYMDVLPSETQEYLNVLKTRYNEDDVFGYLDGARDLRVLVIGETIIDDYQYCDAIGKSSKDPMLVVRLKDQETTVGGILAVANHVSSVAQNVNMVTVVGDPGPFDDLINSAINETVQRHVIRRDDYATIVKRRIVDPYFDQKLLEMYEMSDRQPTAEESRELCDRVERLLPDCDAVITVDFGHGAVTDEMVELLTDRAPFLTVNAQSNAGNYGYHTISRYPRANYVSLTIGELRLDAKDRNTPVDVLVNRLANRMEADYVTVTLGARGSLCYDRRSGIIEVPAVATKVVDRVGAGDAYLSIGSLCAVQGAPGEIVGLAGSAAAAQAINVVGNARPVDPIALRRHITTLFK